ncbi:hypothetical protein JCM10207_006083 [Rhodosporidiobolus poonsookiae]
MSTTQLFRPSLSPLIPTIGLSTPPPSPPPLSPASTTSTASSSASSYTVPPPGALVFKQHLHRPPRELTTREKLKAAYVANSAVNTLEPWEQWLVHAFFLALVALAYLTLSRVFAPSALAGLAHRVRFYLFGAGAGGHSSVGMGAVDAAGKVGVALGEL